MPSGRTKSKDDTWNPDELSKSLKTINDERKKTRDSNRSESSRKSEGGDRRERRKRDEDKGDDRRVRKDRGNDQGSDDRRKSHHGEKENQDKRHRDRDEKEDREKRHRRKEDEKDEDRSKRRERRHHDRDEDEDREKRRERRKEKEEDEDRDKRRERRHHDREKDDDREKRREKRHDRDEDEDRERRKERKHKERDENDDREKRRERRHREEGDDRERRRRKDEDDDRDKRRERKKHEREDDDRDRKDRRHRDKDGERDRKDDDRRRRHRDEDRETRRRHHDEEEEDYRKDRRSHRSQKDEEKSDDRRDKKDKHRSDRREFDNEEKIENGEEKEEADDYNYDDEDFEDYDDDFENDDGSENQESPANNNDDNRSKNGDMDALLEAMDAENKRLLQSRSSSSDLTERSEDRYQELSKTSSRTSGKTFINFVSAKQHVMSDKAASKSRQRGKELAKMIDLEVAAYDMFDMPPLNEYEIYMMSFGRSNTKQAYIQSNEDNVERDIQTEEIEDMDKWTQHPALNQGGCGGPNMTAEDEDYNNQNKPNPLRLGHFMQSAGSVIISLLEEENALNSQNEISKKSDICVSDSYVQLHSSSFLKGRRVTYSHFSTIQTQTLLTIHTYSKQKHKSKADKSGIICVWNVNEPSKPDKILICEDPPTCCCFSPITANLVFAGMSDGSVVVWDLREPVSMHAPGKWDDQPCYIRRPTFQTAGVYSDDNHHSAVTSVMPVISPTERTSLHTSATSKTDTDSGSGLSFQLISLEEHGVLNLWVVAEISNPELAGSDSDLGLSPGGKVKLLKSSTLTLDKPTRNSGSKQSERAYEMQLLPSNPNHYYVGTDSGYVVHGVRHGGKAPPRAYRSDFDNPVNVTSIDFSPFSESCFLAGCADGSLRLHRIHLEKPVLSWPGITENEAGIICVRWSRSRPGVFYVLDTDSNLHIWHLLMNDSVPIRTEKLKSRVTSFCLSNDHSATGIGTPGRQAHMVLAYEDGSVEVHHVHPEFAAATPDELDQFESLMEKLD